MLRMPLFTLALGALAQALPQGCPLTSPGTEPTTVERGTITTSAEAPPEAAAGETITLTATASADVDGGAISYSWAQTSGPGVQIQDADQATASVVAPSLATDRSLEFVVSTANERGDVGRAAVDVRVLADPNYGTSDAGTSAGPVARAGADFTVAAGAKGTLDGSNSRGTSLTFSWKQTGGTSVALTNANKSKATFTAPAFSDIGSNRLEFELTVRDSRSRSAADRVAVTVREATSKDDTSPKPRVRFKTTLGDFVLELNREKAPKTVANFLQYVDDKFYDGTIFHRVIKGFVVQGGGYEVGLVAKKTRDPVQNESSNGLKNRRGTVAMARTNDPDSATSQFYINLVDNASLDPQGNQPGYTVFGRVVEGMDVIDEMANVPTGSTSGFSDVPMEDIIVNSARREASGPSANTTP